MGYREDLAANYTIDRSKVDAVQIQMAIEDLLTQKAIAKVLRQKQNAFQNRYRAAYEAYIAKYPETPQMGITPAELEKVDPGLQEHWRQLYSNDQGTISGKAKDAQDKIEQELESLISIVEK